MIINREPELSAPQTIDDFIIRYFGEFPNIWGFGWQRIEKKTLNL